MDRRERGGDGGVKRGRGRIRGRGRGGIRGRSRGNEAGEASSSQAATQNPPTVGQQQQQPRQSNLSLHHSNQLPSPVFLPPHPPLFAPSSLPQRPRSVRNRGTEAGEASFNQAATENASIVGQQQQASQSNSLLRHSNQPPTPLFPPSWLPQRPRSVRNRGNEAGESSSSQAATLNPSIVGQQQQQQQQPRQSDFPLHRSNQRNSALYLPPRPPQRPPSVTSSFPTNSNYATQARNIPQNKPTPALPRLFPERQVRSQRQGAFQPDTTIRLGTSITAPGSVSVQGMGGSVAQGLGPPSSKPFPYPEPDPTRILPWKKRKIPIEIMDVDGNGGNQEEDPEAQQGKPDDDMDTNSNSDAH